ncbi:hypothetical protein AK812_SmicGene40544 [Symbiodinium microadriaticum]|uniref:Zinc-ribbon domain-containing protein n=1 Tax=Symbiodinium microadriaticum TaxID=2951 RepID=A0A1Q9C8E6_SYMMI|nr:hypothetical protein AK812_SmicGene40544 [Symbiodinium microadriaticum]
MAPSTAAASRELEQLCSLFTSAKLFDGLESLGVQCLSDFIGLVEISKYEACTVNFKEVAFNISLTSLAQDLSRPDGSVAGERFMIPQSDKSRPIDSGKKPGHNDASVEREAAFTSSVAAFQPLLLKTRLVFRGHRTSWLLYVDECAALLFFSFSMIVESPVWSVQRALHKPRCGLALDWQVQSWILPTRRPPAACRVFLGLSVNVALVSVRGFVSFDLKPGYREALSDEKKSVLAAGRLNSGRASKTFKASRALGWVSTGTCGRCGRALLAPLVTRQFTDSCDQLTPALTHCLQSTFSHASEKVVPPRLVRLSPLPTKPTRIYSDASYELLADVPAHLRFVIFAADASSAPDTNGVVVLHSVPSFLPEQDVVSLVSSRLQYVCEASDKRDCLSGIVETTSGCRRGFCFQELQQYSAALRSDSAAARGRALQDGSPACSASSVGPALWLQALMSVEAEELRRQVERHVKERGTLEAELARLRAEVRALVAEVQDLRTVLYAEVPELELKGPLGPLATVNCNRCASATAAFHRGDASRVALNAYCKADPESQGYLDQDGVHTFLEAVFQQHGLTPPLKAHADAMYHRFGPEEDRLEALACLCLADAMLRSVLRMHTEPASVSSRTMPSTQDVSHLGNAGIAPLPYQQAATTCPSCGEPCEADQKFCMSCGTRLPTTVTSQVVDLPTRGTTDGQRRTPALAAELPARQLQPPPVAVRGGGAVAGGTVLDPSRIKRAVVGNSAGMLASSVLNVRSPSVMNKGTGRVVFSTSS